MSTGAIISGNSAREIALTVERAIRRDVLSPGDPLPSIRELASNLGVSPATAASAYRILRERALIVTEQRRGVRVSERPALGGLRAPAELPSHVADLASGNPDPQLLPSLVDGLHAIAPPARLYGEVGSLPELVDVMTRGIHDSALVSHQAVIVAGGLDGAERVLQVHLRPGDMVAVEDPCYSGQRDLIRSLGMLCYPMAIDEHGPDSDALEQALISGAKAVVFTPRAQNPTGATINQTRASELRNILSEFPDRLVIEDDHVGEVSSAVRHTTVSNQRHWALVRSVNKSHGPDLRVGIVMGDEETVSRVEGRQSVGYGWVSTLLQRLALHLLTDPNTDQLIKTAASVYQIRREALTAALSERDIQCVGSSGFNIWIPVPEEDAVVRALFERGWAVRAGEPYRLKADPGIRVTTSTLRPEDASQFASDLHRILRPVRRLRLG